MERVLSRWLSPILLYGVIVIMMGGLVWFVQENLTYDVQKKTFTLDNPIVISAIAIVIGVLFNAAVKLHSEMRDRAFNLILTNRLDEKYQKAATIFGEFLHNNRNVTVDVIANMYKSNDAYDKKVCRSVRLLGNFYEEMAIAIDYKEVNEPMLADFYVGMFIRFYEEIRIFLPVIRDEMPAQLSPRGTGARREVYCKLDDLYRKWKRKHRRLTRRLEKRAALEAKTKSLLLTN